MKSDVPAGAPCRSEGAAGYISGNSRASRTTTPRGEGALCATGDGPSSSGGVSSTATKPPEVIEIAKSIRDVAHLNAVTMVWFVLVLSRRRAWW